MLRARGAAVYGEQGWLRVLVVLLLLGAMLVVGLGAGFMVGRLTAAKPAASAPPATANVRWPGAAHVTKEGAPYGWPDTAQGAVQAATAILQVIDSPLSDKELLGDPLDFNFGATYGAGAGTLSATEFTAWDGGAHDGPAHQARVKQVPSKTRGWPLAYKTDGCDQSICKLQVWMGAVQAFVGVMPATQRWYTATLRMEWHQNSPLRGITNAAYDWVLQQASEDPGPIPRLLETPQVSRDQLPPGMTDWTPYGLNPAG